jgi:hypothetical protein
MEPYGAPWLQPLAIGGESDRRGSLENKPNRCRGLRPVADRSAAIASGFSTDAGWFSMSRRRLVMSNAIAAGFMPSVSGAC